MKDKDKMDKEVEALLSTGLTRLLEEDKFNKNDLFDFRLNMEKMIFSMLIDHHGDLNAIAQKLEAIMSVPARTAEDEREQDKSFHFLLVESTGNPLLISLMTATSKLSGMMIDNIRDVSDVTMKEKLRYAHKNMADALRSGSKQKCDMAVELHYQVVDEIAQKAQLEEYMGIHTYSYELHALEDPEIDSLTGLYVKNVFFRKVEKYVKEHPEEKLLLWASDIQGLRFINEKYGMDIGDLVVKNIASGSRGYEGYIFGGRIGGDKFCVLRKDEVTDIKALNAALLSVGDGHLPVQNVSVKHGIYHINGEENLSAHAMYVRAVMALQSVKNSHSRIIAEYDDKMRKDMLLSRQLEEDAKDSLNKGHFCIYLQPKIDVAGGKVAGAEALVRWIHPQLGFMSPGIFIPLFEKNGFMAKLDLWIWEEVCKVICEWQERGVPVVPISVNVSKNSFEDPDLADKIIDLVDGYGVDHSLFEIEITEYSCLENFDQIQDIIKKLHDVGFIISLDDFGTGYSSMVVLSKIEIDVMKLDMSLIQNDNVGDKRNALEFALQLAQMMQFKTVAEGIETQEQADRIRTLGGDYIQGYFYSKPLPKDEFTKYVLQMQQAN